MISYINSVHQNGVQLYCHVDVKAVEQREKKKRNNIPRFDALPLVAAAKAIYRRSIATATTAVQRGVWQVSTGHLYVWSRCNYA